MPRSSLPKQAPSSATAPLAWFRLKRMFGLAADAGSAQATGKDDPEDLFHVDQVVAGDKTAPAVAETGCKLTMPS